MALGFYYYPAAYGRLGAIKSRGLETTNIKELLERESIDECFSLLKQKPLPILKKIDSKDLVMAEHYLRLSYVLEADRICRFMKGRGRHIFRLILCKIDLYNLKLIARNILSKKISKESMVKRLYNYSSSYFIFSDNRISELDKIDQIDSILKSGIIKKIFKEALVEYNNKNDIFYFELSLEFDYYKNLWQHIYDDMEIVELRSIKNSFFDLQEGIREFLWMVRLKYLTGLENSEIFHYLNLHSSYFDKDDFWSLSENDSFKELMNNLADYKIGKIIIEKLDDIEDINGIEIVLNRYLWKGLNKLSLGAYPFQLVIFLKYLTEQNYLLQDVMKILQGKKGNLSKKDIIEYLITLGD